MVYYAKLPNGFQPLLYIELHLKKKQVFPTDSKEQHKI